MSTPSSLDEQGFLAGEIDAVVVDIRRKYSAWFAELRPLNQLLVQAQYKISPHQESAQEMFCAILYIRSLHHCQAAVLLLERGMVASAKVMIRCALEGLFNLAACAADPKIALAFMDADHHERKRGSRSVSQVQSLPEEKKAELRAIQQDADAQIKELQAKRLTTRDMADTGGLEDLYLTLYWEFSLPVHSSVRDLDKHLQTNSDGEVVALLSEPTLEGLEHPLRVVGVVMSTLILHTAKIFAIEEVDRAEQHRSVLLNLRCES